MKTNNRLQVPIWEQLDEYAKIRIDLYKKKLVFDEFAENFRRVFTPVIRALNQLAHSWAEGLRTASKTNEEDE